MFYVQMSQLKISDRSKIGDKEGISELFQKSHKIVHVFDVPDHSF